MKSLLTGAALLLVQGIATAQPLENGTYDVYFERITHAGKLTGCSLVFTAIAADTAYLRGAQVVLNGSLAMRATGNRVLYAGKLGTRELGATLAGQSAWAAPTHFHFASRSASTAESGKMAESETDGYRLLIGPLDDQFTRLLTEMIESGEFVVGFNRKAGGQDVQATINIATTLNADGTRTKNLKTPDDFFGCVSQLADTLPR